MKRLILISLLYPMLLPCFGQKLFKEYVQNNIVNIRNIDPGSTNFSDLGPIGAAIGGARIVMLGEQDHGDGATMLAKTRLIKYLHEEKGFNVLAFEGEFFSLNEGWDKLTKKEQFIQPFLKENIFPVWSDCLQCSDLLYSYIPSTFQSNTPLQVAGFDSQIGIFPYSKQNIKSSIDQYLQEKNIEFVKSRQYQRFLYHTTILMKTPTKNTNVEKVKEWREGFQTFTIMVDTVLAQLGPEASNDFHYRTLESLREFAKASLHYDNYVYSNSFRDRQMAKNLQWLANVKYPNEKIIVWAANAHIFKNADTAIKSKGYSSINWMGTEFTRDSSNASQTYVLGFSSKTGTYKRTTIAGEPKRVPKPLKKGFETWIDDDLQYGFVNLVPFRKQHPGFNEMFMMKPGQGNMTGAWSNVFDGIFYIRNMTPCELIEPVEL